MPAPRTWTTAQRYAVGIALFTVVSGLIGLAINPDFSVGDDATAETFLVSWNGWHGVVALAVGLPGLAMPWLAQWAVPYLLYRAVTDTLAGVWALLDERPLGLLFLPTASDAVLHVALAAVATIGIVLARRDSPAIARPA